MKLEKSFNSKLYRWFYCTNELPMGFCEYFKKLAIAWLFLIPVGLIGLPSILTHDFNSLRNGRYSSTEFGQRIGVGFIMYVLIYCVFTLFLPFTLFFTSYTKDSGMFMSCGIGFMLWFVAIIFGIIEGIKKIKRYRYNKKREKQYDDEGNRIIVEKKPNIILEFIKAKKEKYCPKIEWIDKKK